MGRFGHYVIDADGHGGEPRGWRRRIPAAFLPQMRSYVAAMRAKYTGLPGDGQRVDADAQADATDDDLEFNTAMRPGMYEPATRLEDMDLEGIDVAVLLDHRRAGYRAGLFVGAGPGVLPALR